MGRTPSLLLVILAACGGNRISSDDDGSSIDANNVDGPPPGTPLDQRLHVSDVSAVDAVIAGGSNWRIWGLGDLRVGRTYTVPFADCGTLVGYTTTGPEARVARLDASDGLTTTYDLGAFELRGLAAEPDGHWAALLWDPTQNPAALHVQRFDPSGAAGWSANLVDSLAAPTDFGIGESRLEYGGGKYGAYYHVHGISGFALGHEGDQLMYVDAASGAVSTQWEWGCSHSMSELLRYDSAGGFLPACVTDCYPGTSGDFSTMSIGGVYLNNAIDVQNVDGGCDGSVAGELGGAAPDGAGWKLVFNAHQNAATGGQSSYNPGTMNQDIGFASIGASMQPGAVTWLTTTAGVNEEDAAIAKWAPSGDARELYVVGWSDGAANHLESVDGSGAVIEGPIAAPRWGERDDPFRVTAAGDIVWAWFDSAGATTLHFARLGSGNTCSPTL